jgi:hypothetical protein
MSLRKSTVAVKSVNASTWSYKTTAGKATNSCRRRLYLDGMGIFVKLSSPSNMHFPVAAPPFVLSGNDVNDPRVFVRFRGGFVSTSATLFQLNTMPSRTDAFEASPMIARRNASRFDSSGGPYTNTARFLSIRLGKSGRRGL